MDIYQAIKNLNSLGQVNVSQAQTFLDSLTPLLQEQIIATIYIGREHIHRTELQEEDPISRKYTGHIPRDHYAGIISDKTTSIPLYLNKLLECAKNSSFDLNNL